MNFKQIEWTEREKRLITLRYYDRLTPREIAKILDEPVSFVVGSLLGIKRKLDANKELQ